MSMNGPLRTPYDNPLVSTPGVGEGTTKGPMASVNDAGGSALQNTPFEKPLVSAPSGDATENSSGIPNTWLVTGDIPNAPAPGSQVAVADGVATPNTPAGDIAGGKDLAANIGIGKS